MYEEPPTSSNSVGASDTRAHPAAPTTLPAPASSPAPAAAPSSTGAERPRPGSHRRRWIIWLIVGVVALLLIILFVMRHLAAVAKNKKSAPQQSAVTTGVSKTGDINLYIEALGTVTPIRTVTVYSQITGQVMSVHFREGQLVKKGDALIDIDPRPSQSTLTQAEGSLQHDAALLAEARMDLARYEAAFARNAIAKQQLDDQAQTVAQDEGTVKADQGSVAYDRVQLAYCHIVSPVNGRVGLRLVDPGNTVFAGSSSTLLVITQLQPTTVVFNVSEDELTDVEAQLKGGQTLAVDAFDRSHEHQLDSGTLTALDNQVDTTTGTIKFRAEFPNKELALFPNQFVNARLRVQTLNNVTLVPSAAVQHNGTAAFVYEVKDDSTVAVQPVTVLTSEEKVTAVKGLDAGVALATSGFDRLEAGAHVLIRNPTSRGGPAQGSPATQGDPTAP